MDLAGSEKVKDKAVTALRKYGVGSCSPPGFYGTIGELFCSIERFKQRLMLTIAFFKTSIWRSRPTLPDSWASTSASSIRRLQHISSVIPAFSKRGDIIVADRGVNFAIQKGLQISRSTVSGSTTITWLHSKPLCSLSCAMTSGERDP
ncbi:hypothetical protein L7F22_067223 [Adiantum nelumboides]|nr:hypothetical protein [Adiantum nelumboides]